ncbi:MULTISPECIES: 2-amino-3,7-dideoxy-D-threo-hept-6-ulosonate synthase [Streptomyces]|uniref:2-amino-4,5-dihydroxy-6-oxo-7-(Phosphonooxy)heptanoate synthase n=1 Tax=Streptomyces pini TaxID=1520580 RepID=A0A1I4BKK7_9ACTN|nr:2-amino-3,7-dideoxy-D-threo-hept-6-ulosonate synthase [Streptomyces pini]SFK69354.1 2-amino-4,5-dihydroxy-6-oxo-7-(phosphonooxy)heptanoate synthase [Streptomyces pini]
MTAHHHFARALRLRRLFRHNSSRLMVVPLDHSISDGPVVPHGSTADRLVGRLVAGGVDAVVLHKGSLRHIRPERFAGTSLILHLNASTAHAPDPDAKYLVTGVEDALRLGADAVSVHVNLGSRDERRQVADLGLVADLCDRWNLPLMAMVYPRGPQVADPHDPELVAHAVTLAADLGADLVKTSWAGSAAAMLDVTAACPIPVLVAGGPPRGSEEELLAFVRDALLGGAAGVAMGRNVFRSPDPQSVAGAVARLVHEGPREPYDHLTGEHRSEREQAVLA